MDSGIALALVLTVVFFGGFLWIGIHSRRQRQKRIVKTTSNPSDTEHKDRAA